MIWNSKARQSVAEAYLDHYEAHARLRPGSVRRYRSELTRGLKPDTIESTVKIVKAVLRYCRDRGWINRLPVWGKPLPSEPPEPDPAKLEELAALYSVRQHAKLFGSGLRSPADGFSAWLSLGLWTGLRLMDLSWNLERRHVLWDRGCVRFRASKTSKVHLFPISGPVEFHLRLAEQGAGDRLFGIRNGQQVERELTRLCEIAGIRRLTPQNIRQASVTEWDALGVGHLIHGCGLRDGEKVPRVMRHYLGVLRRLEAVADQFPWPDAMRRVGDRQLTLF